MTPGSILTPVPAGRRVIFLDIDGVLNSTSWRREQLENSMPGSSRERRMARLIDPTTVARLNTLVARSGAEVVLSSSWRLTLEVEQMQQVLDIVGFDSRLAGRTPRPEEHDPAVHRRWTGRDAPTDRELSRGFEIQQWLDAHEDVRGLAILDDGTRMAHLSPWQVRTSAARGLCDEHIDEALERLERPRPVPESR